MLARLTPIAALLALAGPALAGPPAAPTTERVSVSSSGAQAQRSSGAPALSGNGRFVLFDSNAGNLVPGDTNDKRDVFVRDLKTGKTRRVSVSSKGRQANHSSGEASISSNGRYVVFTSQARNLVPRDTNGRVDVFLHDLKRHTTTRVSVSSGGKQRRAAGHGGVISGDGRSVAFVSRRPGASSEILVRRLKSHKTERVSVSRTGKRGNDLSFSPSISGNGRFIAFESAASNLVSRDTNKRGDVFVRDMKTRTTSRVSVSSSGRQGKLESFTPSISADGRFVMFASLASNLVAGDTNHTFDTFLRDRRSRTTQRISVPTGRDQANGASAPQSPYSISAHGEFAVFFSFAADMAPNDTNDNADVFIRDVANRTTTRVSVSTAGGQGNALSDESTISEDGRFVGFRSGAINLVEGDTNFKTDAFVRGPLRP